MYRKNRNGSWWKEKGRIKMNKEKLRIILDLVVILCIAVAVGILIAFIFTVVQDGGQCVANPAGYYAKVNNLSDICESCKSSWSIYP